jgi:hypothetical protein
VRYETAGAGNIQKGHWCQKSIEIDEKGTLKPPNTTNIKKNIAGSG